MTNRSTAASKRFRTDDEKWEAVRQRNAAADEVFFFSVRTTGVFCRPSCAARLARRENVGFHSSIEAAKSAGFRACKRCEPDKPPRAERHAQLVASACRLIEQSEDELRLDELAQAAGMSSYHFHRIFKQTAGLTPKAYFVACRAERAKRLLGHSATITDAVFAAGYQSSGRFYADSQQRLGMTPGAFRKGGEGACIRFSVGQSSLGAILVARSEKGLCCILLGDQPDALVQDLQDKFPQAQLTPGEADFDQWVAQVVGLVEQPGLGLALPLDVRGTAFQQRVWQALLKIPAGETRSYSEVAHMIGAPKSARAVAQACAANRLAVAIPCHRVVRNDGSLSGYRWGVERKRALLSREAGK